MKRHQPSTFVAVGDTRVRELNCSRDQARSCLQLRSRCAAHKRRLTIYETLINTPVSGILLLYGMSARHDYCTGHNFAPADICKSRRELISRSKRTEKLGAGHHIMTGALHLNAIISRYIPTFESRSAEYRSLRDYMSLLIQLLWVVARRRLQMRHLPSHLSTANS